MFHTEKNSDWIKLISDNNIIEKVNSWIADTKRLNTGYKLGKRTERRLEEQSTLFQAMLRGTLLDDLDNYNEIIGQLPSHTYLELIDLKRDITVNPAGVGIGISQLIPVIIAIFSGENHLTAIEQPELHIHPAMQLNLADVFISAVNLNPQKQFLIETHSEHLILRMQTRIRETMANLAPNLDLLLKPEQVSIYYVKTEEAQSVFTKLDLDEEGEFEEDWPDGFFEERIEEVLG